jgi:hypothetical protein
MSRTIYLDEECYTIIEAARVTDKGLIPKVQALRNLLGIRKLVYDENTVFATTAELNAGIERIERERGLNTI